MGPCRVRAVFAPSILIAVSTAAMASDWTNSGGNAARNGQSAAMGPVSGADVRWTTPSSTLISWQPVTMGERIFAVRQTGFPTSGGAANDAVVCWNLGTGTEAWRVTLPFSGNTSQDWIAWIAGASNGVVYASRSGNGASVAQKMYALNAATGAELWRSTDTTTAGSYDGVVFTPEGDLIVADFRNVTRIRASNGTTAWRINRTGSVSGNCGAAATASSVFIVDAIAGGHTIKKLSIATGALIAQSSVMSGFTAQNSPFLSPDGSTVYFARSQNNPAVDKLYAFRDEGALLTALWNTPVRWTTSHEHAIGPDGSIYTFLPDDSLVRLDPATGAVMNSAGVLAPLGSPNLSAKTAVDASGIVYVSNGWASSPVDSGRVWAFSADLSQLLFTLNLNRQNNGGPAIASDGTLIVCDLTAVRAFRSERTPPCPADFNQDGGVDGQDVEAFFRTWEDGLTAADVNQDGGIDGGDVETFILAWEAGGC